MIEARTHTNFENTILIMACFLQIELADYMLAKEQKKKDPGPPPASIRPKTEDRKEFVALKKKNFVVLPERADHRQDILPPLLLLLLLFITCSKLHHL